MSISFSNSTLAAMPYDVFPVIVANLSSMDRLNFSQTCKAFREYMPNMTIPRSPDGKIISFKTIETINEIEMSCEYPLDRIRDLASKYIEDLDEYVKNSPQSIQELRDRIALAARVLKELKITAEHFESGPYYDQVLLMMKSFGTSSPIEKVSLLGRMCSILSQRASLGQLRVVNGAIDYKQQGSNVNFCVACSHSSRERERSALIASATKRSKIESYTFPRFEVESLDLTNCPSATHVYNNVYPEVFEKIALRVEGVGCMSIRRVDDGLVANLTDSQTGFITEEHLGALSQLAVEILLREDASSINIEFDQEYQKGQDLQLGAAARAATAIFKVIYIKRPFFNSVKPSIDSFGRFDFVEYFCVTMQIEKSDIPESMKKWIENNPILKGEGPIFPKECGKRKS